MLVPKLLLTPLKNRIFSPFDLMPGQKTMWISCLGGSSAMLVPKLLLTPIKIRIFGPKICIFGHFGPNIVIFCTFCPMPDQKTMQTRCLGGFSVMWVTKLLISPVKKGFFAQKPPNLARIWHFWPLLAHSVPCWWVGWWLWRAGCISQDTYLLYLNKFSVNFCKALFRSILIGGCSTF